MLISFKEQMKWLTILDKEPGAEDEHKKSRPQKGNRKFTQT